METLPQQPDQLEEQPLPPEKCRPKKPPIRLVVSRAYTILVLLISLILLFTIKNTDKEIHVPENKASADSHAPPPTYQSTFKISQLGSLQFVHISIMYCHLYISSFISQHIRYSRLFPMDHRSILSASIIGAGCNLFQLGMLIYCMVTGKDMSRNKYKVFADYYCDKVTYIHI